MHGIELIQARKTLIQLLHLLNISDGLFLRMFILRSGNHLARMYERVGDFAQRVGHDIETFQIGCNTRYLFNIGLRRIRQVGHTGNLLGRIAQLPDAVGQVLRVFFRYIQPHRRHTEFGILSSGTGIARQRSTTGLSSRQITQHNGSASPMSSAASDNHLSFPVPSTSGAEIGTVQRILRFQDRKDFFPMIFIGGTIEAGHKEHNRFRNHCHREYLVAVLQVQNLKQGSDDHNRSSPAIHEIQRPFSVLGRKKHFDPVLIPSIFSHNFF